MLERFSSCLNFSGCIPQLHPAYELVRGAHPTKPLLSCVILRSVATKNLLLTFLSRSSALGKAQSRCFTSFSMTHSGRLEGIVFTWQACAFAGEFFLRDLRGEPSERIFR